jgi:O-acetylhomoserine/O-acetylserine sulfhydrylase-like pyridoxal-dependent enzyme
VVLGPACVFSVNSKWHAGKSVWVGGDTVMIDGHRQRYVRNSRHESAASVAPAVHGV